MGYKIIKPADREEWLSYRKMGIGSSEVATIMGMNPYETPYQLWRRKKGLDPAKEETDATKRGHYLEPGVANYFADTTGCQVIKSSEGDWLAYDTSKSYMRVSPDRLYFPKGSKSIRKRGILECKTTMMRVEEDAIPKMWFCQLQYQMGVMRIKHGALAWFSMQNGFGHKVYEFNPTVFKMITDAVDHFWNVNILDNVEPKLTRSEDVLKKFSQAMGENPKEADVEMVESIEKIKLLKAEKKEIESMLDKEEERVKMFMLDADSLTIGDKTLATWKWSKSTMKLDTKTLQAEQPEIYAKYLIEQQGSRRFTIK